MAEATPLTTTIISTLKPSNRRPNWILRSPISSHVSADSDGPGDQPPIPTTKVSERIKAKMAAAIEMPALASRLRRVNTVIIAHAASGEDAEP